MSFTFEQAIAALDNPQYQSLEGLRNLIRQISVDIPRKSVNAVTL
jgi:hypothetical protein